MGGTVAAGDRCSATVAGVHQAAEILNDSMLPVAFVL